MSRQSLRLPAHGNDHLTQLHADHDTHGLLDISLDTN